MVRQTPSRFVRGWMLVVIAAIAPMSGAAAAELLVRTQGEFRDAVKNAEPGDEILLADGIWSDFQMVFEATGTADAPIVLRAETPGEVFITGSSNLRVGGEHLVIRGLTFRDGASPTGEVVSFRRDSRTLSHHVRFTENVIDHFNKEQRQDQDSWVVLYGRNNRVDHNAFLGKTNRGPTMIVRLNTEESQQNGHVIEENFFGGRPPLGGNGGETLRIGVSQTSRTASQTLVRRNYFERCDGEVEIISIKSEENLITENVFFESRGSVVFRHGGRNTVSRNVFLGNGVPDTGGIRVINDNQTVTDNYLEGLRGEKFLGALVVMNGVPNSPQNRYHQVENARIRNNSFIDIAHIGLGVGSDEERTAAPVGSQISGNVFTSESPEPVGIFDDISGIQFADNITDSAGFGVIDAAPVDALQMVRGENGLLQIGGNADVGAPSDLSPVARADTGPSFFEKPAQALAASATVRVIASEEALREAIENAVPGATVRLPARTVVLSTPIEIDKPITLVGSGRPGGWRETMLVTASDGLFILEAGAELSLHNLSITQMSGDQPVLYARGAQYSGSYALEVENVRVSADQGLEEVGPFLRTDPNTFASTVDLQKLVISDWPGSVLSLSGQGLEGWYLSDSVSVSDSHFENIGGALISFGREGRDESTFGPRFSLRNSHLIGVGADAFSLDLLGIDGLHLHGNTIAGGGEVRVQRRVLGFPFFLESNDIDPNVSMVFTDVDGAPLAVEDLVVQ